VLAVGIAACITASRQESFLLGFPVFLTGLVLIWTSFCLPLMQTRYAIPIAMLLALVSYAVFAFYIMRVRSDFAGPRRVAKLATLQLRVSRVPGTSLDQLPESQGWLL